MPATAGGPDRAAALAQKGLPYRFAVLAAELAANTRCTNVVVLDLRGRSPVTEFFVIATGTSPRQMRTVADEVEDLGQREQFKAWQRSGYESARWILVDFVQVVVHVFDPESRDFYDLELLWGDAPRVRWRAELGLPEEVAMENPEDLPAEERFGESAGQDLADAREEEARLEGRGSDEREEEQGDADIDEEAESEAPVVMELPDLSTGSNSVEFVEIDPPSKRAQRGKAVFPTPLRDPEEEKEQERPARRPVAKESLDEDEKEFDEEHQRDADAEAVSEEDLPEQQMETRPMGGVSAGMSSTTIVEDDEEQQTGSVEMEEYGENREEVPPAHEIAAEAVTIRKSEGGSDDAIEISSHGEAEPPARRKLAKRGDAKLTRPSAPPSDIKKAKAGIPHRTKASPVARTSDQGGVKTGKAKRAADGSKVGPKRTAGAQTTAGRRAVKKAAAAPKAAAKTAVKTSPKLKHASRKAAKAAPAKKTPAKKAAAARKPVTKKKR